MIPLADRFIALKREKPSVIQTEMGDKLKVSAPTIKRTMKMLSDAGRIVRIGGKRYGHRQVND